LTKHGVDFISDGFARVPFRRHGITWIPQQLWGPARKKMGLWTICIHPSAARLSDAEHLRQFLKDHAHQFRSFDRVIEEMPAGSVGLHERVYARIELGRVQWRNHQLRQRKPGM
jgi:hypothetical protein